MENKSDLCLDKQKEIMKINIKQAFTQVFINGSGSGQDRLVVFVILAIPVLAAVFIFGHPSSI